MNSQLKEAQMDQAGELPADYTGLERCNNSDKQDAERFRFLIKAADDVCFPKEHLAMNMACEEQSDDDERPDHDQFVETIDRAMELLKKMT